MKLQQLRYIWEVARQQLNVSQAAQSLHTSQPGISKQIKLLEDELGLEIFARSGKHLARVTPAGEAILRTAGAILAQVENIQAIAADARHDGRGSLAIATTHTQCRYVLPTVIRRFIDKFPEVALHMHQGTPLQISELAATGVTDFAIATEALELYQDLIMMPCYSWNRVILVPKGHVLAEEKQLTIRELGNFPLVTYNLGFTGRSKLDDAFRQQGLEPKFVFTAADADVIKTYVRLGLGVGIVAKMAYDATFDADLIAIDASHLFEPSVTRIGFRKGTYLRGYMFDFIEMFAPHLTRDMVHQANLSQSREALNALFERVTLPQL
ncbi:MAG: HTH-type transcriptional regulator CysB [Gammaproteobacteria bacterium]|nr:HTH-type transcriptional regulator CysB [Gammaproteobacteria bacterium]